MKKYLTIVDLLEGDRERLCDGLYEHEVRRPSFWIEVMDKTYNWVEVIDTTIVIVANKLKFNKRNLVAFMNSKLGRYCGDELGDCDNVHIRETILKYMRKFKEEDWGYEK